MANEIKHKGTVESIEGSWVKVKILQASACSSCSVKSYCHSSESKEKIIDVFAPGCTCSPGDEVMVVGATSIGLKAVVWAFVFPFILLLITLFLTMHYTQVDELMSALFSLVALISYYIVLYFFRDRFKKNFSFTMKSINN